MFQTILTINVHLLLLLIKDCFDFITSILYIIQRLLQNILI